MNSKTFKAVIIDDEQDSIDLLIGLTYSWLDLGLVKLGEL